MKDNGGLRRIGPSARDAEIGGDPSTTAQTVTRKSKVSQLDALARAEELLRAAGDADEADAVGVARSQLGGM